jgi:hypothetical protein
MPRGGFAPGFRGVAFALVGGVLLVLRNISGHQRAVRCFFVGPKVYSSCS